MKTLILRLFFSGLIMAFCCHVHAQKTRTGIGLGIAVDYGLNPGSDYLSWEFETFDHRYDPESRLMLGTLVQFKNFQKVQFETGLLAGRTIFKSEETLFPKQEKVEMLNAALPLRVIYNGPSPLRYHSSIAYFAGMVISYHQIASQGYIQDDYRFLVPNLTAGLRLSTEIRKFGRIEYGASYNYKVGGNQYMITQVDDVAPTMLQMKQKGGQWNLSLVYYFSPRTFGWSREKYGLKEIN